MRPLGKENDKAFALINALDATQRSQAILELPRRGPRARARARTGGRFSPKASARRR